MGDDWCTSVTRIEVSNKRGLTVGMFGDEVCVEQLEETGVARPVIYFKYKYDVFSELRD